MHNLKDFHPWLSESLFKSASDISQVLPIRPSLSVSIGIKESYVVSDTHSGFAVNTGEAEESLVERSWSTKVVPFFPKHRITVSSPLAFFLLPVLLLSLVDSHAMKISFEDFYNSY